MAAPYDTISTVAGTSTASLYGGNADLVGNTKEPSLSQSTSQDGSTSTDAVTAPKIKVEDGDDGADDWLTMLAEIRNEEDVAEEDIFFNMTD